MDKQLALRLIKVERRRRKERMGRGRAPCCDKSKVKSGAWSPEEDYRLVSFIHNHGHPNWRALPSQAGLLRCGKSCRLRWINYLRPNVKRGNFTREEEEIVIKLHQSLGNKWSKIASSLPGRTDNEIKNVWNTHLKKKAMKNGNGKCHDDQEDDMNIDHHQQQPSSSSSSSSSIVSSSSNSSTNIDQVVVVPKEASLSHSCSFSSSNSDVGPKDELVDHHHHQLKEWLRCLENELGLGHDQEQEQKEEEEEDADIVIDQSLINISISSWETLFSSLPHS